MNQGGTDADKHTFASFKQMYRSLLTMMRYTPSHATWHRINHWLPCVGLRPYSYNPHESLDLCSRIERALDSLDSILVDDLFLIGKYKACTGYRRRPRRRAPDVQRRVPEDHDDESNSSESTDILINDVMETDVAAWADDCSDVQSDDEKPDETGLVNPWEDETNDATDALSDWAVLS